MSPNRCKLCLRAEQQRSNPESFRGGSLDCFAALVRTTAGTPPHSRGMFRPSRAIRFAPSSGQGRGEGRAPAGTRVRVPKECTRGWTTGLAGTPGLPCAMVLTCPSCSPRGAMHYCPRRRRGWLMRGPGRAARITAGLDASHRTSGPHDLFVRARPRWDFGGWRVLAPEAMPGRLSASCRTREGHAHGVPPCNAIRARRRRVHRTPARGS